MAGMNGYGSDPSTGSRFRPDGEGGIVSIRLGNRMLRDIPDADRLLTIHCAEGGSRQQPRLVAVVTRDLELQGMNTPRANAVSGALFVPCRCPRKGHEIDLGKAVETVERLRYRTRKARRVEVVRLAPGL